MRSDLLVQPMMRSHDLFYKQEKQVRNLVTKFFESEIKADRWMRTKNPLLGAVSPYHMISIGRGDKLLRFVKNQLAENNA